jgi:uncharacterized membrane-anchored protein
MDNENEFRERLVRIETKFEGLEDDFKEVKNTLSEIHTAFIGAKGAKWAIMGSLPIIGFMMSYLPELFKYFNKG